MAVPASAMSSRQIAFGLGWSAFGTAINLVAQFAFMAALARLLEPSAFGLIAMAALVVRLAGFVAQAGLSQALVQRPRIGPRDCSTAFWLGAGLGTLLYAAIAVTAPLAAQAFDAAPLRTLLQVFGLSLPLSMLGALPMAWLRRNARFKRAAALEVLSYCLGYGAVGVWCAAQGAGVWALVAATLAQQTLVMVIGLVVARYPLLAGWSADSAAALWRYGTRLSFVGLLEFASANIDAMLIGRRFGAADLGLYNRATSLTQLPVEQVLGAVVKVLFPALAAVQSDRQRLADGYLVLLLACGLVSTTIAAAIAAAPDDVVAALLGPRWLEVVPVVTVLALAVPPMFCYVACGLTLDATAALGVKARLQAVVLIARIAMIVALAPLGLVGIAAAAVAGESLRLLFGIAALNRVLEMPASSALRVLATVAAWGTWTHVCVRAAAALGRSWDWPLVARVAVDAGAGALAIAIAILVLAHGSADFGPLRRSEVLERWRRRVTSRLPLPGRLA